MKTTGSNQKHRKNVEAATETFLLAINLPSALAIQSEYFVTVTVSLLTHVLSNVVTVRITDRGAQLINESPNLISTQIRLC